MVWLMLCPENPSLMLNVAMSSSIPQWVAEVQAGYQQDDYSLSIISKLVIDAAAVPHFTLANGLLRYKQRIWVGSNVGLQQKILHACHSTALGGHSGIPVTYMRLKQMFAWPGMKASVDHFVKHGLVCQQAKPDRTKLP